MIQAVVVNIVQSSYRRREDRQDIFVIFTANELMEIKTTGGQLNRQSRFNIQIFQTQQRHCY